jgi:hypothetical protein
VPAAPLAGKVVIDTGNYYPQRENTLVHGEVDRARRWGGQLVRLVTTPAEAESRG